MIKIADDLESTKIRTFSSHIRELLNILVPRREDVPDRCHRTLEHLVVHEHKTLTIQHLEELIIKVPRNGFDQGQSASEGVGANISRAHKPEAAEFKL